MLKKRHGSCPVPIIGNGTARKINRIARVVRHYLDDVRIGDLARVLDSLFQRGHLYVRFVNQRKDGGIDGGGIYKRFIALDIDDYFSSFGCRNFRNAICTRNVVGSRHTHTRSEGSGCFEDSFIVCGNDCAGKIPGLRDPFIHMLKHWFRGNWGQNFAGKASGGEARRDHAQDFTRHTRSYHKTAMLDLGKKGWLACMLPSCRKVFALSAMVLGIGSIAFAQQVGDSSVPIIPRTKTAPKADVLPRADIRIDSNMVLIPVTVTDPMNRFVTGLEKENFKVFEDKKEQSISAFSSEDAPLSVGVIFDCSGSMGKKLEKSRQAVSQFFKTANPEDEFFLVQFNDSANLIQAFTRNLEEIQNRLTFTQSKGETALLDAIYLGLHEMKKAKNPRKALLLISDGGDNNSRYTEGEIKNLVKEADVQIYAIGIYEGASGRGRTPEEASGPALLTEIAEQTGGRQYSVENLNELPDIAAKIGVELRNQYILGYSPQNREHDGKYRHVKVTLVQPRGLPPLRPFWRLGYYAPSK
jgi:Ca-activated chloride channel family protein